MADSRADDMAHYLLLLYHKVIEGTLVKHSKRPPSEEVFIAKLFTTVATYGFIFRYSSGGVKPIFEFTYSENIPILYNIVTLRTSCK